MLPLSSRLFVEPGNGSPLSAPWLASRLASPSASSMSTSRCKAAVWPPNRFVASGPRRCARRGSRSRRDWRRRARSDGSRRGSTRPSRRSGTRPGSPGTGAPRHCPPHARCSTAKRSPGALRRRDPVEERLAHGSKCGGVRIVRRAQVLVGHHAPRAHTRLRRADVGVVQVGNPESVRTREQPDRLYLIAVGHRRRRVGQRERGLRVDDERVHGPRSAVDGLSPADAARVRPEVVGVPAPVAQPSCAPLASAA